MTSWFKICFTNPNYFMKQIRQDLCPAHLTCARKSEVCTKDCLLATRVNLRMWCLNLPSCNIRWTDGLETLCSRTGLWVDLPRLWITACEINVCSPLTLKFWIYVFLKNPCSSNHWHRLYTAILLGGSESKLSHHCATVTGKPHLFHIFNL
jgi:hypothetical protein